MRHRFDPQEYLAAYPDAATAVREGNAPSAWGHFVQGGYTKATGGVPNEILKTVRAVMDSSLPPLPERALAGQSAAEFELGGKRAALGVYSAAVRVLDMDRPLRPRRPLRILDFGCGYGRLMRYLGIAAPFSVIEGVDEDGKAIGWCRDAFCDEERRGRFSFLGDGGVPPLPFAPGYFDLVCGVFRFATMPERQQLAWLSELRRVTRPEGFLVLSGVRASLGSYFEVMEQVPPAAGQPDLVLCMRHPALVV